jgi:hypothetical protein
MIKKLKRRRFLRNAALLSGAGYLASSKTALASKPARANSLRVGIVGLSVHSAAFSKILNDPQKAGDLDGVRVETLYHPTGNPDVDFTEEQLKTFEKDVREMRVRVVGSMEEMLALSDVVMIETNDGRPHLSEALPALKAGKPTFIDKPIAENLSSVLRIYDLAKQMKVPIFSSSALRYVDNMTSIAKEEVLGASTYSPAALEKSHTDLFWYGIHAVEPLFAVMGKECREVTHIHHTDREDLIVGFWDNDRVGSVRGIRKGRGGFGGTVFTEKNIIQLDSFTGYRNLVVQIVQFFKTRIPPVPAEETLAIYAFMEAAMESKKSGGKRVSLAETIEKAAKNNANR